MFLIYNLKYTSKTFIFKIIEFNHFKRKLSFMFKENTKFTCLYLQI